MHVSEITTQTVQVQDLPITYYQAGTSGSPLILLHGGGVDSALGGIGCPNWLKIMWSSLWICRVTAPAPFQTLTTRKNFT